MVNSTTGENTGLNSGRKSAIDERQSPKPPGGASGQMSLKQLAAITSKINMKKF